jgi:hypothetical protein
MSISTKTEDSRDKVAELRKHHELLLDAIGQPDALFQPKLAYIPKGKTEAHVSFFLGDFKKKQDIYIEFASRDLEVEDPSRTLWLWQFNPHWEEEYDTTEPMANGQVRYLIPVSELMKVSAPVEKKVATSKQLDLNTFFSDIIDPDQDVPLDQMTVRDLAAILLKKPVSNKKWLNDLIK